MRWRSRLPWVFAGLALAVCLLLWRGYELERERSGGLPAAMDDLAFKIEGEAVKREQLEKRLKRQEHVMVLLMIAPEGPVRQHPELFNRLKALNDGSECIKALTGAVVSARLRGVVTAEDRSRFVDLALECLNDPQL